jgi:hypothetical protein
VRHDRLLGRRLDLGAVLLVRIALRLLGSGVFLLGLAGSSGALGVFALAALLGELCLQCRFARVRLFPCLVLGFLAGGLRGALLGFLDPTRFGLFSFLPAAFGGLRLYPASLGTLPFFALGSFPRLSFGGFGAELFQFGTLCLFALKSFNRCG